MTVWLRRPTGAGEVRVGDGSGFCTNVVEEGDGALVHRQAGLHIGEVAGEDEVERARAGDEIDGPLSLWAAAREVGSETSVLVEQFHVHEARVAVHGVGVHVIVEVMLALRYGLARELAVSLYAAADYLVESLQNGGGGVAVHKLGEAVFGEATGRHERAGVAFQHFWEAAVIEDDSISFAVHLAFAHDADGRDEHSFVEDFGGLGRQTPGDTAANVPEVSVADSERYRLAVVEHRGGEAHIASVLYGAEASGADRCTSRGRPGASLREDTRAARDPRCGGRRWTGSRPLPCPPGRTRRRSNPSSP